MRTAFLFRLALPALLAAPGLAQTVTLQGAGASFPYPLYSKWISEYQKVKPSVRIDYQSIGSGGGIKQITERTVDFGATDAPMNAKETEKVQGVLHHIPMTMGAVAIPYNLPGVPAGLKLTPAVLTSIFMGQIKTWNDAQITALNPGLKLPAQTITVAYRSDSSGTTSVFTEYLAKVSVDWKSKVGEGKAVKFPVGVGAKGNEGVTGVVKTTPGAIGYVELAYANQNKLTVAALKNQNGKFVLPTPEGVTAAASGNEIPANLCLSITNGPGAKDYPLAALTWILVYEDQKDPVKGKALAEFLWWAIHDGQKFAVALDYAPLPSKDLVPKIEARLRTLRANGQPLLAKR